MQFQVPQFIEVEDKIFGPFTFRQFLYLAGGLGAIYLIWRVLPHFIAVPVILCVGGFAAALAFFQWNGRPFILGLEHAFYFYIRSKLYLWSNAPKVQKKKDPADEIQKESGVYIPKLSESKLHELAWSLDIKERIAAGINPDARARENDVMAPIKTALAAKIR